MIKGLKLSLLLALVMAVFAGGAVAGTVTFEWDASDSTVDGYRLFIRYGENLYSYDTPAWQGTETTATVEVLDGFYVYAIVRAYAGDSESENSNEVGTIIPLVAPANLRVVAGD